MNCPSCSGEAPQGSRICPHCGKDLSPKAVEGEEIYAASPSGSSKDKEPEFGLPIMEYLTRPLKDENLLKKSLVGGLLSLIPIAGQMILVGYQIAYIEKIIYRRGSWQLPEWDDIFGYLQKGIMFFLAILIYLAAFFGVSVLVMLPFWGTLIAVADKIKDSQNPMIFCGAMVALFIPLGIITVIATVLSMILPLVQILYARRMEFGDAFDFAGAVRLMRTDFTDYLKTMAVSFLASLVIGTASNTVAGIIGIIPILGWIAAGYIVFVGGFVSGLILISAFAEFYFKHQESAGV